MTRSPCGLSHGPDGPAGDLRRRRHRQQWQSAMRWCSAMSPGGRELTFRMEDFLNRDTIEGPPALTQEPEESMVICTPFDKPGRFYNQKINCMAAGRCYRGRDIHLDPADSFGVLDWGRGVWTYHNTWYWAAPPGRWMAFPSAGTSAMASEIPLPPARICCFTAAGPTSWGR